MPTKTPTKCACDGLDAEPNHAFWQKLILPEEERDLPWDEKGYRWFKSPNIVQLERYRGRRLPRMEPDAAA